MEKAVVQEIFEKGDGLTLPLELPRRCVLGDGKYAYPQEFKWSAVEGN